MIYFKEKENIWTRAMAVLLALVMLLSITAIIAFGNETDKPLLTVVETGVEAGDGSNFVEIGLNVRSRENKFHSAGVVLSFDPNYLIPVDWSAGAAVDMTGAVDWDTAVALPTKGPDDLSGKVALAYNDADSGLTYLYLMAEAARTKGEYNQALPTPTANPGGEVTDPTDPTESTDPDAHDDGDESGEVTPVTPTITLDGLSQAAGSIDVSKITAVTDPAGLVVTIKLVINGVEVDPYGTVTVKVKETVTETDPETGDEVQVEKEVDKDIPVSEYLNTLKAGDTVQVKASVQEGEGTLAAEITENLTITEPEIVNPPKPEEVEPTGTTPNGVPYYAIGETLTPIEQTVVARFKVAEGKTLSQALESIDLGIENGGAAAKDSPLGKESGAGYYAGTSGAADRSLAGKNTEPKVQIYRIEKGTTYSTGGTGGGMSGYSVIFNMMGGRAIVQEGTTTTGEDGTSTTAWTDKLDSDGNAVDVTAQLFAAITGKTPGSSFDLPTFTASAGATERVIFRKGSGESASDYETLSFMGSDGNTYIYGGDMSTWKITSMPEGCVALAAVWRVSADLDGLISIACFDWDNTYLGVVVIEPGTPEREVKEKMDKFVADRSATEEEKAALGEADKTDLWANLPNKPFTNKPGYTFAGWLPYDSDVYTHFGTREIASNNTKVEIPAPQTSDWQSFADLRESISVKACYEDNEELYYEGSALALANDVTERYNRVQNSTTYSIEYTVTRLRMMPKLDSEGNEVKDSEGNTVKIPRGLPRMVSPYLKVSYAGGTANFLALGTSDTVRFTIYPGNTVATITANLIDSYSVDSVALAAGKAAYNDIKGNNLKDEAGFQHRGTVGLINSELASKTLDPSYTYRYMTAAVAGTRGLGLAVTGAAGQTNIEKMRAKWEEVNTDPTTGKVYTDQTKWRDLDINELKAAYE